ncbi:uncharacterized protein MELLADRAFT_68182 [Melampsora larici-populina 98AG31]|uniref:Secreted protein n=1 Tax=Melampsora larici-populina (strain 98AG31 / pathotype 3-4-7) TaxID=747676 RepID=F4S5V5_MELLP|nr:uncharacterized protein MELLADRAFT_68182 [Melampsora larici-populina 98AG31]EGF99966.1 secreted protein [Melampsora larici-populina 98AG31]
MRFTLITIVASLSASAVHCSMIGSGSLVTRAGEKSMSDALNTTSGNGSLIEPSSNSSSVNGTQGRGNQSMPDNNSTLPSLNTTTGNGSSIEQGNNATSVNGTDGRPTPETNLTGASNSTGNGTSSVTNGTANPLLGPLPKNANIDQKIARLEAKIVDHKQKLEHAESKLAAEKQKLSQISGHDHIGNNSAPIAPRS